uniref:Dephospho-CoA kinase domain containing n=1 Tax=Pavo cristatus TaxID=9049 RepID=A0A8C9EMV6_PAVCR
MPLCELTATSSLLRAVISCIRRAVHAVRAADDSAGFQVMQRCDLLAGSRGLRPDYVRGSLSPLAPHLLRSSRAHCLSSWAEVLGYRYVILDIPLLFETKGLTKFMKHTVLVYCDPQTQLARLRKRDGLSQAEAEARVASQLPLEEKLRMAAHVIDNSGDRESTRQQVLRLHARLEGSLDFLWARLAVGTAVAVLGGLLYVLLQHFIS